MENSSQETLRRVEQNDRGTTKLWIGDNLQGYHPDYDNFFSSVGDDFSALGTFIGQNTHLNKLAFNLQGMDSLEVANSLFYDGLKQNISIDDLYIYCRLARNIVGGVGQKILEAYQENNNLTILHINITDGLQNGGENIIATTLKNNTNLKHIYLNGCNITDEQLLPMAEAVRGLTSLEELNLHNNRIGDDGCDALATLLEDPLSNLQTLTLSINPISVDGATALANGLANNTKLKKLDLHGNPMDQSSAKDIFCRLLCNKSSITSIHSSNHTLERLSPWQRSWYDLDSLLDMNREANKSNVAIKKMLKYHPNIIDMEPFFEWDIEGDGERNLKALPFIIAWLERAQEAVASEFELSYNPATTDDWRRVYGNIHKMKLSAIYQFAQAMPLMFVPASHVKGGDKIGGTNKRKWDGGSVLEWGDDTGGV